jgi:hypothetical protein
VEVITCEKHHAAAYSSKGGRVTGRMTKGSEYGAKDLLILSQAFIRTSCLMKSMLKVHCQP